MTKKFYQLTHCPRCKHEHTVETAFGRWLRNCEELKSEYGHIFYDVDLSPALHLAHTYKTKKYGKELQFLMLVEVKTFGAEPDPAQRDSLNILGQIIRNRKKTINKKKNFIQVYPTINKVWSTRSRKWVRAKLFGFHLLQFSGTGPKDSEKILWNKKQINVDQLIKLLKFEIDPDTLRPLDLRIHHYKESSSLFSSKEL